MGVSPQTLINRGYSKSSVYQAHRKLPAVQKRINEFFSGASPHM